MPFCRHCKLDLPTDSFHPNLLRRGVRACAKCANAASRVRRLRRLQTCDATRRAFVNFTRRVSKVRDAPATADELHRLVHVVWGGRSALSGCTDDLVAVPLDQAQPFSTGGNCIVLTRSEARVNAALQTRGATVRELYSDGLLARLRERPPPPPPSAPAEHVSPILGCMRVRNALRVSGVDARALTE
jgi:hypothetical protein